jgi:hypothetical protein
VLARPCAVILGVVPGDPDHRVVSEGWVVIVGGSSFGRIISRRRASPGGHALGVLGICDFVLINVISVQVNRVQWYFIESAIVTVIVCMVAAHLELTGGDVDHFAGGYWVNSECEILTRCIWRQVYKSPFWFKGIP